MNVRAQEAAERIKQETAGKFELQIFPNNQLGSDTDVLSQLRSGGVEFFTLSPLILSTLIPTASISGVGFAFPNYDVVWKAMDGELGAFMRAQITKARLVAMDRIWDNGFRQITTSTKPIRDSGRSARLQSPGAAEPAMDVNVYGVRGGSRHHQLRRDLYSAADQGGRRAGEPARRHLHSQTLRSPEYCSLTNHMWDGFWFLANAAAWEALPNDMRGIIAKNINQAGIAEREDVAKLNASLQGDLAAKGMAFNQPNWRRSGTPCARRGSTTNGSAEFGQEAWSKLENATGRLG